MKESLPFALLLKDGLAARPSRTEPIRQMRHTSAELTMVDYTDESAIGMEAGVLPELVAAAMPAATAAASS